MAENKAPTWQDDVETLRDVVDDGEYTEYEKYCYSLVIDRLEKICIASDTAYMTARAWLRLDDILEFACRYLENGLLAGQLSPEDEALMNDLSAASAKLRRVMGKADDND